MTSAEDECRYWRMCLLLLKICPNVLRQVVDRQSTASNFLNFEDALNSKAHDIFHLRFRKCCCGNVNNYTPLTNTQWDLLYTKASSRLPHIPRGECPCSYQAIPGVTTAVMDVTLCCLIMRNVFPTMMTHVDAIRKIRNELVHADRAAIDNTTFQSAWSAVTLALISLSGSVSTTCLNETNAALKQLKERVLDPSELNALATIMKDYKDYDNLNEKIISLQEAHLSSKEERKRMESKLHELQSHLYEIETRQRSHEALQRVFNERAEEQIQHQAASQRVLNQRVDELQQEAVEQSRVIRRVKVQLHQQAESIAGIQNIPTETQQDSICYDKLETNLIENHDKISECIPVMPLGDRDLTLDQIYSPVILEEDTTKEGTKGTKSGNRRIEKKDVFYNNGRLVERVFMKGEAGRGKTIFGYKLLDDWCRSKTKTGGDEMQTLLSQFKLAFYVSLRHVEHGITNIADMICNNLPRKFNKVIKNALGDENIQCLVILDGLDEWSCPSDYTDFPDSRDLNKCVVFTTTRPWKLEKLRLKYSSLDKVVEIQGLNSASVEDVIKRVITHLHETDRDEMNNECEKTSKMKSDENLTTKLYTYTKRANNPIMKSLMSIPMMLTASCHVWYEHDKEEQGTNENIMASMTYFLVAVIDLVIKRSRIKDKDIHDDYLLTQREKQSFQKSGRASLRRSMLSHLRLFKSFILRQSTPPSTKMMTLFSSFSNIVDFMEIIKPFCKLAFEDLMSKETHLVFEKDQLEKEIGESTVDLALRVGFISQCRAPGKFNVQKISVSFFHKLIQELMAAMHISSDTSIFEKFCEHCDSIDKILDLRNVILLTIGLDSTLECRLSQHLGRLSRKDPDLIEWRRVMGMEHINKVRTLYRTQCDWYNEMIHVCSITGLTHQAPKHVTDVFLDYGNYDSESMRVIGEMMSTTRNTIISVYLGYISDISIVMRYLPQHSASLTALGITGCNIQDPKLLAHVLPQLTQLECIRSVGNHKNIGADVVAALSGLTQLRSLELWNFTPGNTKLNLSQAIQLERLVLYEVSISAWCWTELVSSLLNIQQKVHVTLYNTNIDSDSIKVIGSSPQFTFIRQYTGIKGYTEYEFIKEK